MALDFRWLPSEVKAAAVAAIGELRAAHPGEHFYAFALYSDDDAAGISPAANTEEHLAKRIADYKFTTTTEVNYVRWSTAEWAYEGFGWTHFKPSYDAMMAVRHPPDGDDDPFPRRRPSARRTLGDGITRTGSRAGHRQQGRRLLRPTLPDFVPIVRNGPSRARQILGAAARGWPIRRRPPSRPRGPVRAPPGRAAVLIGLPARLQSVREPGVRKLVISMGFCARTRAFSQL